jgi:hypothetical protein
MISTLLALGNSTLGALLLPNLVAIVLNKVGKGDELSANEYSVILFCGPPALLGSFDCRVACKFFLT